MVETLRQISEICNKLDGKPTDIVRSYLILTEILKILSDNKIIHYTSYLHFQWRADYKVMCSTLTEISRGDMLRIIAEKYNRSFHAVEKIIYNLGQNK